MIQPKLRVSEPGDRYEKEAERIADTVMRMPEPESTEELGEDTPADRIQRMCPRCQRRYWQGKPLDCEECEEELQRRKDGRDKGAKISGSVEQAAKVAGEPGTPLPGDTRSFFESRMGQDFGDVRVHTDSAADKAARSIDAEAFTVGASIAFADGKYEPNSRKGRRLLAHELTHVLQQRNGESPRIQRQGKGKKGTGSAGSNSGSGSSKNTTLLDSLKQAWEAGTEAAGAAKGVAQKSKTLATAKSASYAGRILYEGTCKHLACESEWSCCDSEGGIKCEGKKSSKTTDNCESEKWTSLFTCDKTCDTAREEGCEDQGHWMAIPKNEFAYEDCDTDMEIHANGQSTDAYVRDKSVGNHWEVSPGITDALGVGRNSFDGVIFLKKNAPSDPVDVEEIINARD